MLRQLYTDKNPDMTSEVYGTLQNGKGIKIKLSNIEHVTDTLFWKWKGVMWKHGYNASITYASDLQQVTIVAHTRYSWASMMAAIGIVYLIIKIIMHYT